MSSNSSSSVKPKHSTDPGWEHAFLQDPSNIYQVHCKYCPKVMHGITRLKYHLAGIPKDVAPCDLVPDDVRKKIKEILNAKVKLKEQKTEEICRLRGEVDLNHSEGEGSEGEETVGNMIQLKRGKNCKRSAGPMDHFCKGSLEESLKKSVKEKIQSTMTSKMKEDQRDRACEYIAQWFYEAGIAHNAAALPSFGLMLEAIGLCGRGLRGPTPYELSGPLLQKRKKKVQERLAKHKESWELTGCSVMTDAWTDKKGRGIMNVLVHSASGIYFVKSVDASSDKKDGAYIFDLVDKCIEEIGEKNVVQVVTDTARPNQTMGSLLRAKRPRIYWTGCAAHCIDLMLEDIGSLNNVRNTIVKAKVVTVFLYAHTRVLNLMREYLGKDLVRAGVTRFATAYLNLKSMAEKKNELRKLFRSDEINDWGYLQKDKGKRAAKIVRSDHFWKGVDDAINKFEPLVEVLRRVDGDVPAMGFLYGALLDAKREISVRFDNKESNYKAVWEIIQRRWEDKLKTPLHLAGHYLNPYYYYSNKSDMERGPFRDGLISCVESMCDDATSAKILDELGYYQNSEGSFGRNIAIKQRATKNFNPAQWWANHGSSAMNLKELAVRILNLTCSSSGCERNWSTFEQVHTKKRARLLHSRLSDLVFVKFNSKLLQKREDKSRDPLEIKNVDVLLDQNNEWVRADEEQDKDETSEKVSEIDGMQQVVPPSTRKRHMRNSDASSSSRPAKKKKKMIQVEEDEEDFVSSSSSEEEDENIELNDSVSESENSPSLSE